MTSTKSKFGVSAASLLRVLSDSNDPLVADWARLLLTGESAAGTIRPRPVAGGKGAARAHHDVRGHDAGGVHHADRRRAGKSRAKGK
jgi:hypothetical protein